MQLGSVLMTASTEMIKCDLHAFDHLTGSSSPLFVRPVSLSHFIDIGRCQDNWLDNQWLQAGEMSTTLNLKDLILKTESLE